MPLAYTASLDLVDMPFSEHTPDGGEFLSATEDVFVANNPA